MGNMFAVQCPHHILPRMHRFYHTTFALLIHYYASWMPLDPQHLMLPIQWLRKFAFCHNNYILGPYLARVVGFL